MKIAAHPVYKGLLRKALLLGIPMVPFMVVIGGLIIISVIISYWLLLLLPPAFVVMRIINAKDDALFEMIFLNMLVNFKILKSKLANMKLSRLSIVSGIEKI